MEIGNICYYCIVVPACGIYKCEELRIRTAKDDYYVGVSEKTSQAMIFTNDMIGTYVFSTRHEAVDALKGFQEKND